MEILSGKFNMSSSEDFSSDSDPEFFDDSDIDDADHGSSDRSFESDTDDDGDTQDDNLSQSTLDSLDSQISSSTKNNFGSSTLRDVEIPSFDEVVGPVHSLSPMDDIIQFFFLMFSESFFQLLCEQTNLYARQCGPDPNWNETTPSEIMTYICLLILMGINQLPSLRRYWARSKLTGNDFFKETMSRNRFQKISQYFHINDNKKQAPVDSPEYERLHKIHPLINTTRKNFREANNPEKNQSIDEGMIKYIGHYFAKQYMPAKPIKRGFKVWMRCDAISGYCNDYRPYLGKHDQFRGKDLGERVVLHLCKPLKWKAHHVYFDRFFTSISLIRTLEQNGIYSCGTINSDRNGYPEDLKNTIFDHRGDTEQWQHDSLIATVWKDTKPVHFVSTCCNPVGDNFCIRDLHQ